MSEEELFLRATELPVEEREAFLKANVGDPALLARLQRLLSAHDRPADLLNRPAVVAPPPVPTGAFDPAVPPPAPDLAGTVVAGRYKLLQQIGEGGMGTVWMTDQLEPVKRRVAVKLIRTERGHSKTILARFEAERQAIALMDHPHIAKLLDAGSTDDGSPFFVMELVKGVPLNDFCDAHRLSVPDRLNLFGQICGAVQHAHQKGIIHRDLKPSNILVESHDGKPVPKVIDFGLAKATTGLQLSEHSLFTAFGSVMGTPLYMAPEQATFNAADVDTRADVYALGVILYELLTGTTPISRDTLKKAALDEILRLVREQEAPVPSARISTAEAKPTVAANRQTEPQKLGRFVKGELDWIVLKALAKERERRYESASGLAKDLERFLNHEPVSAGPPTASYRLKKFVRRNRGPVAAGSLLVLTLAAGVASTLVYAIRAERAAVAERSAKDDALEQKRLADASAAAEKAARLQEEKERKFAQGINAFVKDDLLALTSVEGQARFGGEGLDRNATLLDLLRRASQKLKERKDLDPRTEAELCWIVGVNLRGAGEVEEGMPFLERAVELRRSALGTDHGDTLDAMNSLAVCCEAAGKLDLAMPLFEETLKLRKAKLGPDHPDTLAGMNNLALAYHHAGKLDLAMPLFEETLKLQKVKLGPDHPDTLRGMNSLAGGYQAAGRPDRALPLLEETVKLQKVKLGPDHPDTLTTMNNLALGYRAAGKTELGLQLHEETLKLRKAKLGPDHPDTLKSMDNLASAYRDAHKLDLALQLHEETLKLQKAKLGPDHPDTLTSMNNLAACYWSLERLDKSVPLFEALLPLQEKKLGRGHPETQLTVGNLGVNYKDAGRVSEAIPLLEEACRASRQFSTLRFIGSELFDAYAKAGKSTEARKLIDELLADARRALPKDSPQLAGQLANLGQNLLAMQGFAEAEPLLRECLAIREKNEPNDWRTFNTYSLLGGSLLGQKKYAEAEPLLLKGYEGLKAREKAIPLQGAKRLLEAARRLVELYEATGDAEKAAKWRLVWAGYACEKLAMPRERD